MEFSSNGSSARSRPLADARRPLEEDARTVVMTLIGEYDISSRDRLNGAFDRLRDAGHVIFDLTEVSYLDSTAVSAFLRLHKARNDRGLQRETVVIAHYAVRKLFHILDLAQVFHIVDRLEDAIPKNSHSFELDFVPATVPGN